MPTPPPSDVAEFTRKVQHFCSLYDVPFNSVIVVCSGAMLLAAASVGLRCRQPNDIDIAIPKDIFTRLVKKLPDAKVIKAPIGEYSYYSTVTNNYQVDFAPRWGGILYDELMATACISDDGLAYAPLHLFLQHKRAMRREKDHQDAEFAQKLLETITARRAPKFHDML